MKLLLQSAMSWLLFVSASVVSAEGAEQGLSLGVDRGGAPVYLGDHKGKVVVVSLWASWCSSCYKELRELDVLQRKYGRDTVIVVAVNVNESEQIVSGFEARLGETSLLITRGQSHGLNKLGAVGVPQVFVFDQQGELAITLKGYSDSVPALLDEKVSGLLRQRVRVN